MSFLGINFTFIKFREPRQDVFRMECILWLRCTTNIRLAFMLSQLDIVSRLYHQARAFSSAGVLNSLASILPLKHRPSSTFPLNNDIVAGLACDEISCRCMHGLVNRIVNSSIPTLNCDIVRRADLCSWKLLLLVSCGFLFGNQKLAARPVTSLFVSYLDTQCGNIGRTEDFLQFVITVFYSGSPAWACYGLSHS
jgi:hypothetical protein